MTAVHPVGDGQCIALGYESVLPLVLLTLQGGDMKPYELPTEGTTVIARTGAKFNDRSFSTCSVIGFHFQSQLCVICFSLFHLVLAVYDIYVCFAIFFRRADSV